LVITIQGVVGERAEEMTRRWIVFLFLFLVLNLCALLWWRAYGATARANEVVEILRELVAVQRREIEVLEKRVDMLGGYINAHVEREAVGGL
jgi:cell division protein FtsB